MKRYRRSMQVRRAAALAPLIATAVACGGTASPGRASHQTSGPTASTTTGTPLPTPTPAVDTNALLPHDCGTFLAVHAIERAINRTVFPAQFLREKPLPSGRLGRVTCTWPTHVHAKNQHVPAEVSATVNVYADQATVQQRLRLTLATDTANGNAIDHTAVAGFDATLDVDANRSTLLVPIDVRILVVQIDHATIPASRAAGALRSLAAIALRTLPALPSPSASATSSP